MAQRKRGLGRFGRDLARRYGVSPGPFAVGACVVLLLVVVALAVIRGNGAQDLVVVEREEDAPREIAGGKQDESKNATVANLVPEVQHVVVHIDGAVKNPGVYEISAESPRVMDAVDHAGGLTSDASTESINLAAAVADGTKVHIPHEGEEVEPLSASDEPQGDSAPSTEAPQSNGLVNINTASADELKSLSGVGDATAAAIIQDREQNGPFAAPEDLMRVSGIGEKKFAKIQDAICV